MSKKPNTAELPEEDNLGIEDVEIVDLDTEPDSLFKETDSQRVAQAKNAILIWQRSVTKKSVRRAGAVASVLLIALVILANFHFTVALFAGLAARLRPPVPRLTEKVITPHNITPTTVLDAEQLGLSCISTVAWSPDGTLIAFAGYNKSGCQYDGAYHSDTRIVIYDVHSAKVITTLNPDALMLQALRKQTPQEQHVQWIYHRDLLWSPDGKQLALLFGASYSDASSPPPIGIWVGDITGREAKILLFKQQQYTRDTASPTYTEWDIAQQRVIEQPSLDSDIAAFSGGNFPPASSYVWGDNGELLAQGIYAANATSPRTTTIALNPVGNPIGGNSFSMWQSGDVQMTNRMLNGFSRGKAFYLWVGYFAAWSPDSRYIIDNITTIGRMQPAGHPPLTQKDLLDLQAIDIAPVPVRDAALQNVLASLQPGDDIDSYAAVSWAPSGRTLVAARFLQNTNGLNLYQCSTGYQMARLVYPKVAQDAALDIHSRYFPLIHNWSPDGSMFLANAPATNIWTIWQIPSALR